MRVVFCDIDGVVNSMRSCMAFGSYPWDVDEENLKLFDHVALGLIRQLCKDGDIKIVLTSTWRIGDKVYPKMAQALELPIIDRTSLAWKDVVNGYEFQSPSATVEDGCVQRIPKVEETMNSKATQEEMT
jgi:hypothetical protein